MPLRLIFLFIFFLLLPWFLATFFHWLFFFFLKIFSAFFYFCLAFQLLFSTRCAKSARFNRFFTTFSAIKHLMLNNFEHRRSISQSAKPTNQSSSHYCYAKFIQAALINVITIWNYVQISVWMEVCPYLSIYACK